MKVILNGEEIETSCINVLELLLEKGIQANKVAVEVNGEIVPKSQLGEFAITENSKIEIITFVGGG
jgi:thiamine biosynthesis protein ThiS